MKRDTCKTCRWWWSFGETGHCRRYPPSVAAKVQGFATHPLTDTRDWCGEHKRKDGV